MNYRGEHISMPIFIMVIAVLAVVLVPLGCMKDDLVTVTPSAINTPPDDSSDGGGDDDECVIVEDAEGEEAPIPLTKLRLEESHYEGWEEGDDSYGPEGDPVQVDDTHAGFLEARCWDCHAVGTRYEPVDHDPSMQYWAWSCARGFPGSECHGHGYNGCYGFNHANDPSFFNCTTADCHIKFHEERYLENHAMDNAPDAFCNACHDYYWSGWPEDEEKYKFSDN